MAEETDDVAGECPLCFVSLTQGSLDFLHASCRAEVAALRRALEEARDELRDLRPQVASGITLPDNVKDIDRAVADINAALATRGGEAAPDAPGLT